MKKRIQQLMQPLESRRLMSLTAGAEIMPPPAPMAPQAHFSHSFGFEHAQPDTGFVAFNPGGQVSFPHGDFSGGFQDGDRPDWQASDPSISATATVAVDSDVATAVPTANTGSPGVTLSEMYSTIGASTVAQIDAATTQSLASVVSDSLADPSGNAFITQSASPSTTAIILTNQPIEPESIVTSDKALAKALTLFATPSPINATSLSIPSASEAAAPTWAGLHKLGDELAAVRAIADQLISELGRDSAIALSHLESVIDPQAIVHAMSSSWKPAALLAGAVATVALVKNESDKKPSPFSSRLIEDVLA